MSGQRSNKALVGTSILLALTSSLCCILPVLAIAGGIGGFASSLAWVEPLRPYLMAGTAAVLGTAFYRAYKPKKADHCGCAAGEKKSVMASKGFLWTMTVISALLMTFPYYSGIFIPKQQSKTASVSSNDLREATFQVEGMTCKACEEHVNSALLKQDGVVEAVTDYEKGQASVKFDISKISPEQLALATEKETGYKVKP